MKLRIKWQQFSDITPKWLKSLSKSPFCVLTPGNGLVCAQPDVAKQGYYTKKSFFNNENFLSVYDNVAQKFWFSL